VRLLAIWWLTLSAASAGGLADEAELHFQLGAERYLAKDYLGALEHFLASNRLVPNRNVLYNIARSFEQLRRYPDAHRYYVDALEGETKEEIAKEIRTAIDRIAPHVAVLEIQTAPPGATIYLDRKDLGSRGVSPRSLGLPPGRYRVLVELEGHRPAESEVLEVGVGKAVPIRLELSRVVGTVRVEGHPGANVFVDGDLGSIACVVPCELALPPGPHALDLARDGHQALPRQVNVVANQISVVHAELAPLTGSLVVHTDERDALVEIDGRSVGFTPAVVHGIAAGQRHLRVSLKGYRPIEQDVVVRPNEQTELIDLTLHPMQEVTAASRVSESIEDAPSSVSVIDGRELRAFAYPTIAEALRGLRGIHLQHDGVYTSIGVRGLGQPEDYGNRFLVLLDGAQLNDDILNSSYVGYDGRTDLDDIDQIELVRGAGSVVYGTGAVSGVVNLVTRPRGGPTTIEAGIGTAENSIAHGRVAFNLGIGDDAGVRASVAGARSAGHDLTFAEATASEVDAFKSATVQGGAWWGPVSVQAFYTLRDETVPFGPYGFVFDDPTSKFLDQRTMVEAKCDLDLKGASLLVRTHVDHYRYAGKYLYPDYLLEEKYQGLWLGGEVRFISPVLTDALHLSIGAEAQRHFEASMYGEAIEEGEASVYLDEDRPFSLGAIYAVIDAAPIDWFRLQAGGRLDAYSTFGTTFNPRVAAIFKPGDADVIKLVFGRAFRSPSVYEQYYNDGGETQIAGNDSGQLGPETSYSGELEYTHAFNQDWSGLAAVHATYIDDIIETRGEATPESPLQYANSTEPVIAAGGDIEVRRVWRQGWMFSATYGYQMIRYRDAPEASLTGSTRAINAPEHLASIRGVAPIVPPFFSAAARVTLEAPRRISLAGDETSPLGVVADIVVSGDVERFGLHYAAGVYNLFDWRYGLPVSEGWPASTMPQNGRTFRVTLGVTY
jgi:outer membrane receptor for ferrienterochelin and colicins